MITAHTKLATHALLALTVSLGVSVTHAQMNTTPLPATPAITTPLIPRAVLFSDPERAQGRVSPDGKYISFLAPMNGVMNVWVGPVDKVADAKPITAETKRGIRQYFWAYTSTHVLYLQDQGGNENWHLHCVDLATAKSTNLTPLDKTQAQVSAMSDKFPDQIIVGLNNRTPALHDLYRINIRTGERELLLENTGFAGFSVDDDYRVRIASRIEKDGSMSMLKGAIGADGKPAFEPFLSVPMADALLTSPSGFSKDGSKMYLTDSRDRNTAALFAVDMTTGEKKLIFEDPRCDVSGMLINPITKEVDAVESEYLKPTWSLIQTAAETPAALVPDLMAIRKAAGGGTISVNSRSQDDTKWTVAVLNDNAPPKTWLVERGDLSAPDRKPKVTLLWANKPALSDQPLVPMRPVVIKSRDGLDMVCYLSLPKDADPDNDGKPSAPVPMVLNVHGGPWARDSWGLNTEHQWLANRGYAVLSVNYRGSTGFGKDFVNKANLEWAGKMHDDLIDAVNWAIGEKIAIKDKVAIYGGSYGGYATLTGLTFTPDTFACGVSIVGPSSLVTLLNSFPAYWGPSLDLMTKQIGDHRTEEGRKFLESRSPLTFVDRIQRPLLIAQGANDPRVTQVEADQIVKAMQAKNIPVTYALYPDEGHGFARPPNRMSFYAVAEAFLAKVLGGRAEPIGNAFKGSSIQVPVGHQDIQGLSEALNATHETAKPNAQPAPGGNQRD